MIAPSAGRWRARCLRSAAVATGHAAPLPVVIGGPVGGHAVDQKFGRAERDAEAFPGQRVDVTRRVTDQQHPPRRPTAHLLTQRACSAVMAVIVTAQAIPQRGEGIEVFVESGPCGT